MYKLTHINNCSGAYGCNKIIYAFVHNSNLKVFLFCLQLYTSVSKIGKGNIAQTALKFSNLNTCFTNHFLEMSIYFNETKNIVKKPSIRLVEDT